MRTIKICNVIPGMMNVEIIGTVGRIFVKEYSSERGAGKVCNIMLSDSTGSVRLVLWNDEIQKVRYITEGVALRIRGYVRQGMFGPEIMIGKEGFVEVSEKRPSKTTIAEIRGGQRADIRAALVQLFESSPFYEVCPKCGTTFKGGEYRCVAHGEMEPDYALRVSGVIDDGTGSVRCVFFQKQAEKILGLNAENAKDIVLKKGLAELFRNAQMKEFVFSGHVRRNEMFDRTEFVINRIKDVDPVEEIRAAYFH